MRRIFITLITVIFSISFSYGQGFIINGLADCGLWHQGRNEKRAGILEASVQGFINGVAMGTGIDVWGGNGVNTELMLI